MTYSVKEMYFTLQGEGAQTGRAAIFLRFAGCNLWTGLERDRSAAVCRFCDTNFVGTDGLGGGKFTSPNELAQAVASKWSDGGRPYVVCTGGEPLLQLDEAAISALHAKGFEVGVETNGTQLPPFGLDWVCVSPKAEAELVLTHGDELKLVYPQVGAEPERYADLEFAHFFVQPMDNAQRAANTAAAIEYCKSNPKWRLSLQIHKLVGIP